MVDQKKRIRQPATLTIHPSVLAEVDARGDNRSAQIEGDLRRYYALLRDVRADMRLSLGKREQAALLHHMVRDHGLSTIAPGLDAATLAWYDSLSVVQRIAVWDAADRYWFQRAKGAKPEPRLFEEDDARGGGGDGDTEGGMR